MPSRPHHGYSVEAAVPVGQVMGIANDAIDIPAKGSRTGAANRKQGVIAVQSMHANMRMAPQQAKSDGVRAGANIQNPVPKADINASNQLYPPKAEKTEAGQVAGQVVMGRDFCEYVVQLSVPNFSKLPSAGGLVESEFRRRDYFSIIHEMHRPHGRHQVQSPPTKKGAMGYG